MPESDPSEETAARVEALVAQLVEVVGEHCHAFVFAAQIDNPQTYAPHGVGFFSTYRGGINMATGLAERLRRRLQHEDEMIEEEGMSALDKTDEDDSPEFPETPVV